MSDMKVKKYKTWHGKKMWKISILIPLEMTQDAEYIKHLKKQLKERCIKEYIDNVEGSFEYRISSDRVSREAELSMELEDLFSLKERNKRLRQEIRELVDDFIAYKNMNKAR